MVNMNAISKQLNYNILILEFVLKLNNVQFLNYISLHFDQNIVHKNITNVVF